MIANHIHDALAQVRKLQVFILERNQFKGYSGTARMVSGAVAIGGAIVMSADSFPASRGAHLAGWGVVLALGLLINYGALIYWFLFDEEARRDPMMLTPAIDAIPALVMGGVIALALVLRGQHDLVFGACLSLYGLAQVAYRRSLPKPIYALGFYYLACGAVLLLHPGIRFVDPWPMALAFCVGEELSGVVLVFDHHRHREANAAD